MAVTAITLVHVNAVEMSYFDFILNMAKEICYFTETFYLIFQTKHITFVLLSINQSQVLIAKKARNIFVFKKKKKEIPKKKRVL